MTSTSEEFFDSHFHVWDASEAGVHDSQQLGEVETYGRTIFEKALQDGWENASGGIFVEAMSVCFPTLPASELQVLCLKEAQWAATELDPAHSNYRLVVSACLEHESAAETLRALKLIPGVCGVRQIANFNPSWPRNTSNLLDNHTFVSNFAVLEELGLVFDMQVNPWQLPQVADLAATHPRLRFVINHLGTPTSADLLSQDRETSLFWTALQKLASNENIYMKVSMLTYADPKWDSNDPLLHAVRDVIRIIGPNRCFFGSNFPVEQFPKSGAWTSGRLRQGFEQIAQPFTSEEQRCLFHKNAKRCYFVA